MFIHTDLVSAANLWKMHIIKLHNYRSQLRTFEGKWRTRYYQNYAWDTARRIIQMIHMIIIHVYTIVWCFTQLMELIVGAGRPVETWSGSSLWANWLYNVTRFAYRLVHTRTPVHWLGEALYFFQTVSTQWPVYQLKILWTNIDILRWHFAPRFVLAVPCTVIA